VIDAWINVIGNSRSGTTWLTRVLRELGKDVGHEYVRKDGTVSCFFFIDCEWYPYNSEPFSRGLIAHVNQRLSDYRFEHTVHLVRHPLKAISSIAKTAGTEHQLWLEEHKIVPKGLKPKLLMAMHIWEGVERACRRRTRHLFKLEELVKGELEWRRFCKTVDLPKVKLPPIPVTNASRGIFKAKKISWTDLYVLDAKLAERIEEIAIAFYGYNPEPS